MDGPGLDFYCSCLPGWNGRVCEKEINECDSNPCHNGGICVDKLNSYLCACPMGYAGSECEEEIQICETNPCKNNALCLMEEGIPTCYCVPDFHGSKCEYQYDECLLNPKCMNGGLCIDGVDSFWCSCPPSLTGLLCECYISNYNLECGGSYSSVSVASQFTTIYSVLEHNFEINKTQRPQINISYEKEIQTITDDSLYRITLPTDEQSVETFVETIFPFENEPTTTEMITKQSSEEYYTNSESLEYYDSFSREETTEYELLEETTTEYLPYSEAPLSSSSTSSEVVYISSETSHPIISPIINTTTSIPSFVEVYTDAQTSSEHIPQEIEILDKTSTVANIFTEFITKGYDIFNTSLHNLETTPNIIVTSKPLHVHTPEEPSSPTQVAPTTIAVAPTIISEILTTMGVSPTTNGPVPPTSHETTKKTTSTTVANQYYNTIPPDIIHTIFDCNKYSCANGGTCITYVDGSKVITYLLFSCFYL